MPDPRVTIVIPCSNHWDLTRDCLEYIAQQTTYPNYRVIVVDDGSTDATPTYLAAQVESGDRPWLKVLRNDEQRGFAITCNRGMRQALADGTDYILLLNNDIQLWKEGWLSYLMDPFLTSGIQRRLVGAEHIDYNEAARVDGEMVPYIGGWCMLFPAQLVADIGFLDEELSPAFYEDVLYSAQAAAAGYRLLGVGSGAIGIHHISSQTANDGRLDVSKVHQRNKPLFQNKIRSLRAQSAAVPWRCANPPRIAFFLPGNRRFDDRTLDSDAGLGGAEAALVQLTRELVRQGAEVTVYCDCPEPGITLNGVTYRDIDFDRSLFEIEWDEFVLFRTGTPRNFWDYLRANRRVFWSCDQYTDISLPWPQNVFPFVDEIVCISPHHRQFMMDYWGSDPAKTTYTNLGVHWPDYEHVGPKVPNRLIFCSVPDRGLEHMARIFPLILEEIPDAELIITADYTLWGRGADPGNQRYFPMFDGMPGVQFLGKVPRAQLIELQKSAELHVFPCDHYVEMPSMLPPAKVGGELFCLASLESQAAGAPSITTALGALATTVDSPLSGVHIPGEPGDPVFYSHFAGVCLDLLTDQRHNMLDMAHYARARVRREFSYDVIARQWLSKIG